MLVDTLLDTTQYIARTVIWALKDAIRVVTSYYQIASIGCASPLEFCLDYAVKENTLAAGKRARWFALFIPNKKRTTSQVCCRFIGEGSSGLAGVTLTGKPKLMVAQ